MFSYRVYFKLFNLKTNSNYEFNKGFNVDKPLVSYNEELDKVEFNFEDESFSDICEDLNVKLHPSFKKKLYSAIKRRLRGTSQGIQVVFRDEDNLIWHCFVTITDTFK